MVLILSYGDISHFSEKFAIFSVMETDPTSVNNVVLFLDMKTNPASVNLCGNLPQLWRQITLPHSLLYAVKNKTNKNMFPLQ